jgi:hypothetical protein
MSKFSLVGAECALVKIATLWSDDEPMGQRHNVTERRRCGHLAEDRPDQAPLCCNSPRTAPRQFGALAQRHRVPAIYEFQGKILTFPRNRSGAVMFSALPPASLR